MAATARTQTASRSHGRHPRLARMAGPSVRNVADLLTRTAARHGQRAALVSDEKTTTWVNDVPFFRGAFFGAIDPPRSIGIQARYEFR